MGAFVMGLTSSRGRFFRTVTLCQAVTFKPGDIYKVAFVSFSPAIVCGTCAFSLPSTDGNLAALVGQASLLLRG